MPGKHLPSTNYMTVCVDRELIFRLDQYSASQNMTRNSYVGQLCQREMDRLGVVITHENKERAMAETVALIKKRAESNTIYRSNKKKK